MKTIKSYRDRIKGLRRVRAGDLIPDLRNWRRHPVEQESALRTMMNRLGVYDAVIARETPDGLMLVDGHLRAGLDPDAAIPVLVVDLSDTEAAEAIASHDPLAAMAEQDTDALRDLVTTIDDGDELADMLFDDDTAALLLAEEADWTEEADWPDNLGKKQPLVEMTFIVSEEQKIRIDLALRVAAKAGAIDVDDPHNKNKNGCVLAAWADAAAGG